MTSSAFEILSESTFRVGDKAIAGHFCDPPERGKWKYAIEATSDERSRNGQHLFVHDFREVRPVDLPNGISIVIQSPKSEFRQVGFAEINKINDRSELIVTITFDYADWHHPLNLQHFAERYCDAWRQDVAQATNCHIDRSEIGLYINCSIQVSPEVDYLSAYQKIDAQVLAVYRKCLSEVSTQNTQPKTDAPSTPVGERTDSGAKWWVRYVIVPVIGSGAVAALVAAIVALLK